MGWVDVHCHVDLYNHPDEMVCKIEQARIYTVAVTNLPSQFRIVQEKVTGLKYVRAALGLHPQLASTHLHELAHFRDLLSRTRYISEVGLDGTDRLRKGWEKQRQVFQRIIDWCATAGGKILTVHSRRAEREVIDIIGDQFPGEVILHWYTGNIRELEHGIERGFYFSINPAMLRSLRGRQLVMHIPRQRILTESDGPFIRLGKRPAHPQDVRSVVQDLASVWKVPVDVARQVVFSNFQRILNRSGDR